MSKAKKKKKFTLWIYNTLTGLHEEVEVSEEVYRTYKRTQWNIEKNNQKYYDHEIQFSGLIGGENGNFENFREFIVNTFENSTLTKIQLDELHRAINNLCEPEKSLIQAVFFNEISERDYAAQTRLAQKTVNNRKRSILRKLKKVLENQK